MDKTQAIAALGGSITAAAEAIGVTYQAVDKWPDQLPPRIADRVQAALWRMSQRNEGAGSEHGGASGLPPVETASAEAA
jgi:hypothetical protein